MDQAVALIETYLRVNGYFTVTEYPMLEASRYGGEASTFPAAHVVTAP